MTPATALVRLPNHLGDAILALPALRRLEAAGWQVELVARPWAADLFSGCSWPIVALPVGRLQRIARLRAVGRNLQGVLLTNSFSSALEFRLAGIRAAGYARDGRGWLLSDRIASPDAPTHMVGYYLGLVDEVLRRRGGDAARLAGAPPPPFLDLPVHAAARIRARRIVADLGVGPRYCVLCPVAVGRHRGQVKAWSGFPQLCRALLARGEAVIGCPGPGEVDEVTARLPGARILAPTDLATFAALLAESALVVANDSGPGHVAAAVGARLLSVFGVTQPEITQPWGSNVVRVGGPEGWPEPAAVLAAAVRMLADRAK